MVVRFSIMRNKKLISFCIIAGIVAIILSVRSIVQHTGRHYYTAKFAEAPDLKQGTRVTIHGIQLGEVSSVALSQDSVTAIFWVKNADIREGTRLALEPRNLFGDRNLVVYPGNGESLPSHAILHGSAKKGLGETIVSLASFVEHLDSLAYRMIHLTADAQRSFNETAEGLDQTISSVEKEAIMTLQDVREIASSTHGMLDKSTGDLTATIGNLRVVSAHLKSLLETADTSFAIGLHALASATSRLDTLTSFLIAGKGTIGKLFASDTLYTQIDSTLHSLRNLLDDIKGNPKKYFNLF
jgi:phospholipid/cholesterol/gamma-HCH transport system substrate-binding protein